jgi:C4-dicarboxylate-specific signal transduction histidine kinase
MGPADTDSAEFARRSEESALGDLLQSYPALRERFESLETRVRKGEKRRRALLHIMSDLNKINKRLADQRKAMLHILDDYEKDRSRLGRQTEKLDNSRRALLHLLKDAHQTNLRLGDGRKAMIHIMGDLSETTAEVQSREQELRDKQEQLVQAAKLATLGELTTGVAHELNNPLNNIGLFIGNAIDQILMDLIEPRRLLVELGGAMQQVRKATEIISHLRTFGRAAPVNRERLFINEVVERALSLMQEQLRDRQIGVRLELCPENPVILGNAIQLEQVFINVLTNAGDALTEAAEKLLTITCRIQSGMVELDFRDSGPGIPPGLEERIFDPFFTTKEVGRGTGLGLSIAYGIIKEHQGSIVLHNRPGEGATFVIQIPLAAAGDGERSQP